MAAERPAIPSLALRSLVDEACGERARQSDPEHDRQASNLIFQGHPLADQLLARDDQRAERMSLQRLHMHRLEKAGTSQMRQTSRVVAIGLVGRQRLERLVGLPALHTDHGQTELAQPVKQDRRHPPSLEHDATATRRFHSSAEIASAVDAVLLSQTTTPSRSRTQTCVSFIEISRPAK
jgi:hypothetical protein